MTKKILHVGKYYYPFNGGIETVIKDLAEGCVESGCKVRVICSAENNSFSHESINDVEIYRYPQIINLRSLPISPGLWFSILHHARWADVIHVHSPNPICEFFSSFISKKKVVVSTHHSDVFKQRFLKFILRPMWWLFRRRLDRFIVPTINHIKFSDMIRENADRYTIIPFGIYDPVEDVAPAKFLSKSGIKNYVLFVGRLVDYKGLPYLIEAMKDVQQKLIIVGTGAQEEELKNICESDANLREKVAFTGRIESYAQLNDIYSKAFCFVLPSITKNENFGVVQLEAMAHGKPVVTTNIESGVPAVGIPNETTILVDSHNPKALSDAINRLYNEPELAIAMGMKGRQLFLERYTLNKMVIDHLKLYEKLINEKNSNNLT